MEHAGVMGRRDPCPDLLERGDDLTPAAGRRAQPLTQRAPRDDEQRARLASSLGSAYFRQQRLPDAQRELTESIALLRGIDADVRQPLASALSNLGTVRFAMGDPNGAGECFDQCRRSGETRGSLSSILQSS